MNYLIVASYTVTHHFGGRERNIQDLSFGLASRGHRVFILTGRRRRDQEREEVVDTPVLKGSLQTIFLPYLMRPRVYTSWFFTAIDKRIIRLAGDELIDVILNQNSAAYGPFGMRFPAPFIHILHGTPINEIRSAFGSLTWKFPLTLLNQLRDHWFLKRTLNRADSVITVSDPLADDVVKQYGAFPRMRVVNNGVDPEIFQPGGEYTCVPVLRLLSAGFLTRQKGFGVLLKAARILREQGICFTLQVAGSGPHLGAMKRYVARVGLGSQVQFLGRVDRDQMVEQYQKASLFVFPTRRQEGLPYVVLEALACGIPVVATRIGGISDVLKDGINGVCLARGDADEVAKAIVSLVADPVKLKCLSDGARRTILENFTIDKMVSGYEVEVREVVH